MQAQPHQRPPPPATPDMVALSSTAARAPTPSVGNPPTPAIVAQALRDGIDPGPPLTKSGRAKRTLSKRGDEMSQDNIYRHRYPAAHIKRAFDLFGYIPTIINNGITRRARLQIGESVDGIMTAREYSTFEKIVQHLPGFDADIVRYCEDPLKFRDLVQAIQESAHSARSNDLSNIKKDLGHLLVDHGSSSPNTDATIYLSNDKSNRGFQDDVTGRYLCPTSYDWDNLVDRQKLRDGHYPVTADVFPRLLYAGCAFDPDDLEVGLGRNLALVKTLKYIFTGRSSAISSKPGGKTTRAGNAQLAGMTKITPNTIAYGACVLRFALSQTPTWTQIDMEFDMEILYWNIVDIFHDDRFSEDLLAWWNRQVFGTSLDTGKAVDNVPPPTSSMSILKEQRAAKRARLSEDLNVDPSQAHRRVALTQSSYLENMPARPTASEAPLRSAENTVTAKENIQPASLSSQSEKGSSSSSSPNQPIHPQRF